MKLPFKFKPFQKYEIGEERDLIITIVIIQAIIFISFKLFEVFV